MSTSNIMLGTPLFDHGEMGTVPSWVNQLLKGIFSIHDPLGVVWESHQQGASLNSTIMRIPSGYD